MPSPARRADFGTTVHSASESDAAGTVVPAVDWESGVQGFPVDEGGSSRTLPLNRRIEVTPHTRETPLSPGFPIQAPALTL